MAVTSITRMQHRRGLKADLPASLAEGEIGWCLDSRELYIGNSHGYGGNTNVLTEFSPNEQLVKTTWGTKFQNPVGAISRSLHDKLSDSVSVKDFGARADGTHPDSSFINQAIASLYRNNGPQNASTASLQQVLHLPSGIYLIDKTILCYPNLTLCGDGVNKTMLVATDSIDGTILTSVDSIGQSFDNIGLGGPEYLPTNITVANMTILGGQNKNDLVNLVRSSDVLFLNVAFIGTYSSGDGTAGAHAGVKIETRGNAISSKFIRFSGCMFNNVTYGILCDDPVENIMGYQCRFQTLLRGITLGENANYDGPLYTTILQSRFEAIDNSAIALYSPNPGIASVCNTFINCGITDGVDPIVWHPGTRLNTSQGDVFIPHAGVSDQGTDNVILDPQQTNVSGGIGVTGPTGPTGPASTIAGPIGSTGPTGANSNITGPTGYTGPTGVFALTADGGDASSYILISASLNGGNASVI